MVGKEDNPYIEERDTDRHSVEVQMPGKDNKPENNDASVKKLVNAVVLIVLLALIFIALFSFFSSICRRQ
ncbi:hypothetical protein [Methanosarcina horonobensis]|uniref:hypothetical protein n=1 Tax=Methanosarcina horonobensis TaxID=418008 RepID=UPI000A8BB27D|nr:hypothetical protein [Methanosarcina horonobensis]